MKFTLRHLQVFLAVAREQSISRAAESLCMSQSATSAAVQELEHRYEVQLFDRSSKRLRLNHFGSAIRIKAEALMSHAKEFDAELLDKKDNGSLRIGASLTIGNYLAAKYLAVYMQQHPEAKVEMDVVSTPDVVAKVLNFSIDVGLIEADMHHDDLLFQHWREDNMIVFCAPSHPLAKKKTLSDKDILKASWILREPGSGLRLTFDRSMQGLLPKMHITLEFTHNEAIKNAVKTGLGIGCLSEIAIADEIQQGLLVPLALKNRSMTRSFYFVTHKKMIIDNAVNSWIELCKNS